MSRRADGTWRYDDPAWRKVRKAVLERDGGLCRVRRGEGCTSRATEVDHIVPVGEGGAMFDAGNLRASCRWCNRGRRPAASSGPRVPCRMDGVPAASSLCEVCGQFHRPSRDW